jgi:hypothetical protein
MSERIKFKPGSNSETRKNSVVLGQRDEYVFRARPGQQLTVHISSIEDNAGFEIHVHETGEPISDVEPSGGPSSSLASSSTLFGASRLTLLPPLSATFFFCSGRPRRCRVPQDRHDRQPQRYAKRRA